MATALQPTLALGDTTQVGAATDAASAAARAAAPAVATALDAGKLTSVSVRLIRPSPYQPRKVFAPGEIEALAENIRANGLLHAPVVRFKDDGRAASDPEHTMYELIAGERRVRAMRLLGYQVVPVVKREVTDEQAMDLALVENIQRADLTPLEEAEAYDRHMRERGLTQVQVAALVGKPRSTVQMRLGLLAIPAWRPLIESGEITVSQAVELYRHRTHDEGTHLEVIARMRGESSKPMAEYDVGQFRAIVASYYADLGAPQLAAPEAPVADEATGAAAPAVEPARTDTVVGAESATVIETASLDVAHDRLAVDVAAVAAPDVVDARGAPEVNETAEEGFVGRLADESMERMRRESSATDAIAPSHDLARAMRDRVAESEALRELFATPRPGMFTALAPLVAERRVTVMLAKGTAPELLRLTIIPVAVSNHESAALTTPLSAEGTPAELDAHLVEKIAEYLASRPASGVTASSPAPAAAAPAATTTTPPAKRAAKKPAKKGATKASTKPVAKAKGPAKRKASADAAPDAAEPAGDAAVAGPPTVDPRQIDLDDALAATAAPNDSPTDSEEK